MIDIPDAPPSGGLLDDSAYDLDGAIAQATAAAARSAAMPTPAPPDPVFVPMNGDDDEPPERGHDWSGGAKSRPAGRSDEGPLPWFYAYLGVYAKATVWIGIIAACILVAGGIIAAAMQERGNFLDRGAMVLASALAGLAIVAVVSFIPAFILLALDVGKSLRRIAEGRG